jgi:hypothetical protein
MGQHQVLVVVERGPPVQEVKHAAEDVGERDAPR